MTVCPAIAVAVVEGITPINNAKCDLYAASFANLGKVGSSVLWLGRGAGFFDKGGDSCTGSGGLGT